MHNDMKEKNNKGKAVAEYWPLISLIAVSALGGVALSLGRDEALLSWMHYFMGMLLCQFSLLKLFDIRGFADGYQMYDLIAKRSRAYALSYPFIELFLGLAYLSFFMPLLTYSITVLLMGVGTIGVIKSLRKGLDIHCSCMGSILKVPLSTVTLSEDLGMGLMALLMLAQRVL